MSPRRLSALRLAFIETYRSNAEKCAHVHGTFFVLRDVARWMPKVMSTVRLTRRRHHCASCDLNGGRGKIIQCELMPTILGGQTLPCEAVSDTWGPAFKAATVDIHGKRLLITYNLNLILYDLSSLETDRIL
ncbi:hypothetical protein F5X98DRAFT_323645 [Xylaria grammica]|nr:hypothetical protein F5X98DRAFT_323645 [Xylaria grammica]